MQFLLWIMTSADKLFGAVPINRRPTFSWRRVVADLLHVTDA